VTYEDFFELDVEAALEKNPELEICTINNLTLKARDVMVVYDDLKNNKEMLNLLNKQIAYNIKRKENSHEEDYQYFPQIGDIMNYFHHTIIKRLPENYIRFNVEFRGIIYNMLRHRFGAN
jgi:hypothetical protein